MISIDEIEQHISNTEDFLKSNQENVVRRSNPNLSSITSLDPTKQSSNPNNILENENSKATISSDNRYSDPKEREILIQKLLSDYNERKERRKTENYFDVPDTEDLTSSRRSLTSFNKSQEKEKKVDFTQSTIKWSSRDANTTNSSRKKTFDYSDDDEDEGASELSADTLGSKQDNREREDNLFFASDILTSSLDVPNQQDRSFEGYSWSLPPPPPLPQPQPPQPQHYQQPPVIPPRSSRDMSDVRSSLQGPKERGRTRTPPKLRSTTKRTASSSSVDRGSRSQSADRVHLSTKDKLKEEAEKEFKKQHPFKPTRATASRSPTAPPTHHSARQSKSHFFDRLEEMSKEHHQRMRKKEKLRSELEKLELVQCTFQPEITQKSKKLVQRKGKDHQTNTSYDVYKEEEAYKEENNLDSLSERLYQEAAIRKKRNHYLSKYMGELEEWNCTFQPSINDNTDKILQKSFQSKQQHQPQQQQHQRVTSTSLHHRAKRASSLSPGRHLSKDKNKSNQTASDSKSRYYTPIHQRVTELQREKQRHLRELKQSREEEQANVLTFRPSIAKKSKTLAEKKFHKEGYAYPLTVENSNNKEESEKEGDSGTESGRFLVKSDVAHRLLNEGRKLARRKQELLYQREQELAETLEKPVMSVGSQKLVYTNQHLREEFTNRQKYYEKKSMIYQDHIHDKEEKKYEQYFQPNIQQSKSLQILKQKKPDLLLETTNEKYERLSIIEADLLNEKKQLLMKKYYNSLHYPFQPEINYISKIFGKKSTINDLYENNLAKQSKELLKKQLEEEMNEECTFQPKINEKSKQMIERQQSAVPADDYERFYHEYYKAKGYEEGGEEGGDGRGRSGSPSSVRDGGGGSVASVSSSKLGRINLQQPEKMFQEIQLQRLQKENRRKEELIAREIEELQECTFQPMLHQNHSFLHDQTAIAANEPIIIKGLNRHLELKQLADKLKKEEQEREFNAFHVRNVDKFRRQKDGSTIVKTFDLRVNSPKRLEKKKVYSY